MTSFCENLMVFDDYEHKTLKRQIADAATRARSMTAWRLEGTLREFAKFDPVNCWFRYPIHVADESGALSDIEPESEMTGHQKMIEARKKKAEKEKVENLNQIEIAFEGLQVDGSAAVADIAEEIGVAADTIKRWFGKGKRSKPDYKKRFETFQKTDDERLYIRRKDEVGTDGDGR